MMEAREGAAHVPQRVAFAFQTNQPSLQFLVMDFDRFFAIVV
jgi:hypothetical protein